MLLLIYLAFSDILPSNIFFCLTRGTYWYFLDNLSIKIKPDKDVFKLSSVVWACLDILLYKQLVITAVLNDMINKVPLTIQGCNQGKKDAHRFQGNQ